MSKGLITIGATAFASCVSLVNVTIPASVQTVEGNSEWNGLYYWYRGPFAGCTKLETVTFEEGMKVIPAYIMSGVTGLVTVNMPDTVTEIGAYAFEDDDNLMNITFSDELK